MEDMQAPLMMTPPGWPACAGASLLHVLCGTSMSADSTQTDSLHLVMSKLAAGGVDFTPSSIGAQHPTPFALACSSNNIPAAQFFMQGQPSQEFLKRLKVGIHGHAIALACVGASDKNYSVETVFLQGQAEGRAKP